MLEVPKQLKTRHGLVFAVRELHPSATGPLAETCRTLIKNRHWAPTIDRFWVDHSGDVMGIVRSLQQCLQHGDQWFVCTHDRCGCRGPVIALGRLYVDRDAKSARVGCWVCAEYAAMGIARTVLDCLAQEARRFEAKKLVIPIFSRQQWVVTCMDPLSFSLFIPAGDPERECCWYERSLKTK